MVNIEIEKTTKILSRHDENVGFTKLDVKRWKGMNVIRLPDYAGNVFFTSKELQAIAKALDKIKL